MGGIGSGPRPTHTVEEAREIVRLMREERLPLIKAADRCGIALATAHELIMRHEDVVEEYRSAQEALADHYAQGALDAVEDGVRLVLAETVDAKRANAVASATRNLSERRAWAAKVLSPARYGDAVRHTGTLRHEHAVVMLPPLAPLTPPLTDQAASAQVLSPQRVTATARLSAPAPDGEPDR